MAWAIELIVSLLLVLGALFAALGALGVVVLPSFLSRVHGPSVVIGGGLGTTLIGAMIWFVAIDDHFTGREIFVSFILALTTPITAHALSRAWLSLHPKLPMEFDPGEESKAAAACADEVSDRE